MSEPLLRMEHITKRFPGVLALDDVSLEILPARPTVSWARTAPANRPC